MLLLNAGELRLGDDLASALEREDVSEGDLAEIAAAHAMEIVGPPSESYV